MCFFACFERILGPERFHRLFPTHEVDKNESQHVKDIETGGMHSASFNGGGISTSKNETYRYESGRRYMDATNVKYVLPNDDEESDRIHQQHWMLRYAFQGNHDAPVGDQLEKGIVVLDSGCGPATWTLEMAELYPESTFYGIDTASVFPDQLVPGNCQFQVANLTEGLPFPDNYFDYVHQRLLVAGLTADGWDKCLSELIRVLKPGGILELKEVELDVYNGGALTVKLVKALREMLVMKGLQPSIGKDLDIMLKNKGMLDIKKRTLDLPMNYGGKLGQMHWDDFKSFFIALKPVFMKMYPDDFGHTEAEFEAYVEASAEDCAKHSTTVHWHCMYATKPLGGKHTSE